MKARLRYALAFVASTGAALAVACGSSSDATSGGGADASSSETGSDGSASGDDGSSTADGNGGGDVAAGDAPADSADAGDAMADVASDAPFVFDGDAASPPLTHMLATGGAHSCVIRSGGAVRCWGNNSKGQLGGGGALGGTSPPVDVVGLTDAVELTAGYEFTCARRAGGGVRCWGDGSFLGVGADAGSTSVPVDVTGLSDAVQISARSYHTCALRANHHVACWGANYGRIGDGTTTARYTPTEPLGPMDAGTIDDAISVGTGWGDTCIAHTNGTMTCSGEYNPWGQLGDGYTQDRFSPVSVLNMSTAIEVGLGLYTSCARLASGQIQCWGNNQGGQLGLGTTDQNAHSSPVDVPGMTNMAEISPAGFGTCALTQTHQVYCWGYYVSGSGNGNSSSPLLVGTSGPVAEVSGGDEHACARLVSGEVQCWGNNYAGQIGGAADAGALVVAPITVPGL